MDNRKQATQKKRWTTPKVTVYGPVEQLTRQIDKKFGPSDGYTFMGDPIANAS